MPKSVPGSENTASSDFSDFTSSQLYLYEQTCCTLLFSFFEALGRIQGWTGVKHSSLLNYSWPGVQQTAKVESSHEQALEPNMHHGKPCSMSSCSSYKFGLPHPNEICPYLKPFELHTGHQKGPLGLTPVGSWAPHSHSLASHCSEMGERIRRLKVKKLLVWDKGSFIGRAGSKEKGSKHCVKRCSMW